MHSHILFLICIVPVCAKKTSVAKDAGGRTYAVTYNTFTLFLTFLLNDTLVPSCNTIYYKLTKTQCILMCQKNHIKSTHFIVHTGISTPQLGKCKTSKGQDIKRYTVNTFNSQQKLTDKYFVAPVKENSRYTQHISCRLTSR